jgi:hypothetical protein
MSNTSTGNSTMSKTTPATKRVTKKTDTPATSTPALTPAAAAPVVAKDEKAKKAKPVVAAAPTATAVEVPAVPVVVKSVDEEIAELVTVHQKLRDESVAAIKTLQRLQKRVARDMKEAGKRRKRVKKEGEDGVIKEKRPTTFTTPVTLKDDLCSLLGKAKGTQMTPADVTRAFKQYVEAHSLKDVEKGHTIHPDAAMRKALSILEGEEVTYRNIQKYLYKQYILPEKKKVVA